MRTYALSDVGLVRKDNEDSYLVSAERGLFVVADGMGGHMGGQMASTMAVQILDELMSGGALLQPEPGKLLQNILLTANERILVRGRLEQQYYGMGTTVTAALMREGVLYIAHIGDSRAYLYRGGNLSLLTRDHSLVNELFCNGSLTLEEAQNHPQRNILTRALGIKEHPEIDLTQVKLEPGDKLLLCTDGLFNHVHDPEIKTMLEQEHSLDALVRKLVDQALALGGYDNITVVAVHCE